MLLVQIKCLATHIVGGEMYYDYLGNNQYRITLKIYRDCLNGQAQFDENASITVRDAAGNVIGGDWGTGVYGMGAPAINMILPSINSKCIQAPNNVCVEEGIYTHTVTLTPKTGGYYITYQRCCRNNTVSNLLLPGQQGSTYFIRIPGPEEAVNNSSARFDRFPPLFLCNNLFFNFDHSATDPDGDQLIYSFVAPYQGLDACCPIVGVIGPAASPNCPSPPPSCPQEAEPSPYVPVNFIPPYSSSYPISSNPSVVINPQTGMLSGKPNQQGQFVVGICVSEFRAGKLINKTCRDFQFNIISCTVAVASEIKIQDRPCEGNTITFTNQSTVNEGTLKFHWDFGVPGMLSDTSNVPNPTYTYQDTGKYTVTLIANPGKTCADTSTSIVHVYPALSIKFPPVQKQCLRNNSFDFQVAGDYHKTATFNWSFDSTAIPPTSTNANPNAIKFTQGGLYNVKLLATQFACRDSFIDTVRIIGRPLAKINNLAASYCVPAKIGFSNGSKGEGQLKYEWRFSDGTISYKFEPVVIFNNAGLYGAVLKVESTGFCKDSALTSLFNITVHPLPNANFTVTPKQVSIFEPEIIVKSISGEDIRSSVYNFGDGTGEFLFYSGSHFYNEPGTYIVSQVVSNHYGCRDTAREEVRILPEVRFWIPNAFTPDNNDKNDLFMPVTIGLEKYKFEIFNKWGERLYITKNPQEGWDGSFKNKACQQDTYIWKISFINVVSESLETKTGHFTLLRNP
jgi:gliding motility-associated-like protein